MHLHRLDLLRCCFGLIGRGVKICRDLDLDPSLFNHEIPDPDARLDKQVPEEVRYACHYWAQHLSEMHLDEGSAGQKSVYEQLRMLFTAELPYWLMVLNTRNSVRLYALPLISKARNWLQVSVSFLHLLRQLASVWKTERLTYFQQGGGPTRLKSFNFPTTPSDLFRDSPFPLPRVPSTHGDRLSPLHQQRPSFTRLSKKETPKTSHTC